MTLAPLQVVQVVMQYCSQLFVSQSTQDRVCIRDDLLLAAIFQ